MPASRFAAFAFILLTCASFAQSQDQTAAEWSWYASLYAYAVPEDQNYGSPAVRVDRGSLHLEARYNYEDLDTGSAWIGYNFSLGEKWVFEAVPMLGGVFGQTDGVAAGWELSLSRSWLEIYSESEYVIDTWDSSENFYYHWSEFTLAPRDWLRFGAVIQRTKVYQTDLDVQRGILIGSSFRNLDFSAIVFNLGWDDPTFVISAGAQF